MEDRPSVHLNPACFHIFDRRPLATVPASLAFSLCSERIVAISRWSFTGSAFFRTRSAILRTFSAPIDYCIESQLNLGRLIEAGGDMVVTNIGKLGSFQRSEGAGRYCRSRQ